MITLRVYKGKSGDNEILLKQKLNGVLTTTDLSDTTEVKIVDEAGAFSISSEDEDVTINWNTGTKGKIVLTLGLSENLIEGTHTCWLEIYDVANENGIPWEKFILDVIDYTDNATENTPEDVA